MTAANPRFVSLLTRDTLALVLAHPTRRAQRLAIVQGDARAEALLPDRTVGTYTWAVK